MNPEQIILALAEREVECPCRALRYRFSTGERALGYCDRCFQVDGDALDCRAGCRGTGTVPEIPGLQPQEVGARGCKECNYTGDAPGSWGLKNCPHCVIKRPVSLETAAEVARLDTDFQHDLFRQFSDEEMNTVFGAVGAVIEILCDPAKTLRTYARYKGLEVDEIV